MKKEHYPEPIEKIYEFHIPKGQSPERLDQFLTRSVHNATRNKVQQVIENGQVLVNGNPKKVSYKISPGDYICCSVLKSPPIELIPENIPLNIVFEDEHLLVVNKPAGMCVHPGIGNRYGTLVNALLFHFGLREAISIELDDMSEAENDEIDETKFFNSDDIRPGLVHRIDKDTTGLLVVAKNANVHQHLAAQFANKTTQREYYAIVWGKPKLDKGRIEGNIGRSPRDRKAFAVLEKGGKTAVTDYEVIERFAYTAFMKFKLQTGRTHQIRVHSGYIGHKLFGDSRYGGDKILFGAENPQWRTIAQRCLDISSRQMLHAKTLGFRHPITNEDLIFDSELPTDMQSAIIMMERHNSSSLSEK